MENENFIEKLANQFGQRATVKNVFGEPIQAGDKTIIPVAQIAFGLGGGYGQGNKKYKQGQPTNSAEAAGENSIGHGAGGGGGLYARPKGVYEVTAGSTRQMIMGIAIGFLIKAWFFRK